MQLLSSARSWFCNQSVPVFVTSNSKLAYTFRDYIIENGETGKSWSSHALPVISDNMLLYRIWLPFAAEFSNLPALTLPRFAYSAQSEGIVFFEEFRKVAAELDRTRNVDLISTTEAARRKLEDILIRETSGELDQITSEIVAMSFDECVRMEHYVVDKAVDDKGLRFRIYDRAIDYVKQKYVDRITAKIDAAGYGADKEAVIDYCLTHTKALNKSK